MKTKTDMSYGVVPVRKNAAGEFEVFILNQISVRKDIYWTFPKGHPEEGETPEETAARELKEEAGLVASFDPQAEFIQQYDFVHEGVKIYKKVIYFLGYIEDQEFILQPQEVVEAKWCSFKEAERLLTHQSGREILQEVVSYLQQTAN